ncbi:hypothetical protein D0865_07901 [Hortaea werneckii]|uniref:Mitochondrial carrier n=1 Tax=Hortaea werneckii TaxID=91943 RepID=A0A3M7DDD6_HORWE|nr:hypothetical protein D0865_07901 [Hortaea werneckii]RMY62097.1 hypothetical protein D0863_11070 [Hortaea werneckii]
MGQNDQDKNDNAGSQSAKANSMSGDQDKKKDADSQLPTPQDGKIQDKQDKSKDPNLQTPSSPGGKAQDDQEKKKDADSQPPKPKSGTNAIFQFHTSKEAKQWAKKYRTEIAASTSSVLSTFVAFPLDFAKSRMQSYETGFVGTVKDAYKAEGIRAFWRGVGPPMVSVTVVRTISFSIYQHVKYTMDKTMYGMTGQSPLAIANAPGSYPNIHTLTCFGVAGAASGAVITALSCPFELTKLNEQLAGKVAREAQSKSGSNPKGAGQNPSPIVDVKSGGSWNTARRLVRDRGVLGLYAGYRLHLLRDTIGTAIYFTTYESAKQLMANSRGKNPTTPYAVMFAGGLCGILTTSLIYPIDVAKTLYQKALLGAGSGHATRPPISFFQSGSYRGLAVSVVRSCLLNMIFFSNFELIKKHINSLDTEEE